MKLSFNWWVRKIHRWGALLIAIPLLLVIASGLLLQLKKEVAWIQPPTRTGNHRTPSVDWQRILEAAKIDENANVNGWKDIDRLDVRPDKGVIKVRCANRWEIQMDAQSGEVLSSALRRSDLIETLHDGSFFSNRAKLFIFLPNGIILLGLWMTGIYLWYLPLKIRRQKRKRIAKT